MGDYRKVTKLAKTFGATVLDDSLVSFTIELAGEAKEVDQFVSAIAAIGEFSAVARSGSVAVSKGEIALSSYATHHKLTG